MPKLQQSRNITISNFLRYPKISDIIPFLLIFLASRSSLLGISPFAVSMFCGAFDLKIGYMGLLASALGFLSCGTSSKTVTYLITMLIFWLYSRLHETYKSETILSSCVCGILLFICSFIQNIDWNFYNLILILTESIVCSFSYVLFKYANSLIHYSRSAPTEQELISGAVCTGIFISGLNGACLFPGVELSGIISSYVVMSISLNMSLSVAACCGVAAGLICSMNDINAVIFTGLYGLSAMFGNMLKSFNKYGVAIGFLGSCSIILLYIGNSITISVAEIIIACFLFVITPQKIHKAIGNFILRTTNTHIVPAEVRIREHLLSKMSSASHAFAKLASVYRGVTEKRLRLYSKDLCRVIDDVTNRVCISCPYSSKCMSTEKTNSFRIIFSALETLELDGFCNTSNAPSEFKNMCQNSDLFLCELAHVYELYKRDLVKHGEYSNNRDLMISQYEEISEIFSHFYEELGNGFCFLPEAEEKTARLLSVAGYSIRDIKVIENGLNEIEIYIRLNHSADKKILARKISDILSMPLEFKGFYLGGMMKFSSKTMFSIEYGEKQVAKSNQITSGDSITSFRTENDKFYVLICDGMGSGSSACRESRITTRLLEEFIKDGFSASTAVSLVNSSLALGNDKETFSSVDLLEIDLISGNASFYKIGGCKSFFKRGNNIDTIFSPSLPIGIIPGIHISCITRKLENDDLIIMLSDGAEGTGFGFLSGEKMKRLLSDTDKTMTDIATSIVESAGAGNLSRIKDDISVAVVKIIENL